MVELYDVGISSEASADLSAIYAYIVQDSPDDAARFLEHLLDSIQSLERLPRLPSPPLVHCGSIYRAAQLSRRHQSSASFRRRKA